MTRWFSVTAGLIGILVLLACDLNHRSSPTPPSPSAGYSTPTPSAGPTTPLTASIPPVSPGTSLGVSGSLSGAITNVLATCNNQALPGGGDTKAVTLSGALNGHPVSIEIADPTGPGFPEGSGWVILTYIPATGTTYGWEDLPDRSDRQGISIFSSSEVSLLVTLRPDPILSGSLNPSPYPTDNLTVKGVVTSRCVDAS